MIGTIRQRTRRLFIYIVSIGILLVFACASILNFSAAIDGPFPISNTSTKSQPIHVGSNPQRPAVGATAIDQEQFFQHMKIHSNDKNVSFMPITSNVYLHFIYKQSTYTILEGWKEGSDGNKEGGLLILQKSISTHNSDNSENISSRYRYDLSEFIHFPKAMETSTQSDHDIINDVHIASFSEDKDNCYILFSTYSQYIVKGHSKATSNLFSAPFTFSESTSINCQKPSRIFFQNKKLMDLTLTAFLVIPDNVNPNFFNTLVFADQDHTNNEHERSISISKLTIGTNCVLTLLNPSNIELLAVNNFHSQPTPFSNSNIVTKINRDNYSRNNNTLTTKNQNILFITILDESNNNLKTIYACTIEITKAPVQTKCIISLKCIISQFVSNIGNDQIGRIEADMHDNLWFSLTRDFFQNANSDNSSNTTLGLLDTKRAMDAATSTWSFTAVIQQFERVVSSGSKLDQFQKLLKNELSVSFNEGLIVNPIAFDISRNIHIDYSEPYSQFVKAKTYTVNAHNLSATLFLINQAQNNFLNDQVCSVNLADITSSSSKSSYDLNPKLLHVIDKLERNKGDNSPDEPVNFVVANLCVFIKQIFYHTDNKTTDSESYTNVPVAGANKTSIFLWTEQVKVTDTDKDTGQLWIWNWLSLKQIFTPSNNYNSWGQANPCFHAGSLTAPQTDNLYNKFFDKNKYYNSRSYLDQINGNNVDSTNYFSAVGPFTICADMSEDQKNQHVTVSQQYGIVHNVIQKKTKTLTKWNTSVVIGISSGYAYKYNQFANAHDNVMTREIDNTTINIQGYSQTKFFIGLSYYNYSVLDSKGANFFEDQNGNAITKNKNNNIGDNTLTKFEVNAGNYFSLESLYFEKDLHIAGFYYFLHQSTVQLNFGSKIFRNNVISESKFVSIATIISIQNIRKDKHGIVIILPSLADGYKDLKDIRTPTISNNPNQKFSLNYSDAHNHIDNIQSLNSTVNFKNNRKKQNLLGFGLFLIRFQPVTISDTHSLPTFFLIQIGGSHLTRASNWTYLNLHISQDSKRILLITTFIFFSCLIVPFLFIYIVLLRIRRFRRFRHKIGEKYDVRALGYSAHYVDNDSKKVIKKQWSQSKKHMRSSRQKVIDRMLNDKEQNSKNTKKIPTFRSLFRQNDD